MFPLIRITPPAVCSYGKLAPKKPVAFTPRTESLRARATMSKSTGGRESNDERRIRANSAESIGTLVIFLVLGLNLLSHFSQDFAILFGHEICPQGAEAKTCGSIDSLRWNLSCQYTLDPFVRIASFS